MKNKIARITGMFLVVASHALAGEESPKPISQTPDNESGYTASSWFSQKHTDEYYTQQEIDQITSLGDEDPSNDLTLRFTSMPDIYMSYIPTRTFYLYIDNGGANWAIFSNIEKDKYILIGAGEWHDQHLNDFESIQTKRQYAHPEGFCQNFNDRQFHEGTRKLFMGFFQTVDLSLFLQVITLIKNIRIFLLQTIRRVLW